MTKDVLIVDDETNILTSVEEVIRSMGHQAKTASSGKEALKILQQESFDLVLLDILMPKMSGGQVLQKIRADKKLHNLKVVFFSVVQVNEPSKEAKKLGVMDYIQKPISLKDLKNQLIKFLK